MVESQQRLGQSVHGRGPTRHGVEHAAELQQRLVRARRRVLEQGRVIRAPRGVVPGQRTHAARIGQLRADLFELAVLARALGPFELIDLPLQRSADLAECRRNLLEHAPRLFSLLRRGHPAPILLGDLLGRQVCRFPEADPQFEALRLGHLAEELLGALFGSSADIRRRVRREDLDIQPAQRFRGGEPLLTRPGLKPGPQVRSQSLIQPEPLQVIGDRIGGYDLCARGRAAPQGAREYHAAPVAVVMAWMRAHC